MVQAMCFGHNLPVGFWCIRRGLIFYNMCNMCMFMQQVYSICKIHKTYSRVLLNSFPPHDWWFMTSSPPLVRHITVAERNACYLLLIVSAGSLWHRWRCGFYAYRHSQKWYVSKYFKWFKKVFLISNVTEHWIPLCYLFHTFACYWMRLYLCSCFSSGACHWLVSSIVPFDLRLPGCFHLIVQWFLVCLLSHNSTSNLPPIMTCHSIRAVSHVYEAQVF